MFISSDGWRRGAHPAAALCLVLAVATPAWAGTPTEEIRGAVDAVLRILKDPELKAPSRARERREALRRTIDSVFDFDEMTGRALGLHWRERTDEERRQFVPLFRALLERAYLRRIEAYSRERIVYGGESVDGDYATVRTKIVTVSDTDIPVDYLLLRRGGPWRVYDVRIEGISLVENYRDQFNAILDESSYAALVEKIRAKLNEPSPD